MVSKIIIYVVVQIYSWFKFYFSLFLAMVMYDNESETMGKRIYTKEKTKPQHIHVLSLKKPSLTTDSISRTCEKNREFKMLLPRRQLKRQNWQLVKIGKTITLHVHHALLIKFHCTTTTWIA